TSTVGRAAEPAVAAALSPPEAASAGRLAAAATVASHRARARRRPARITNGSPSMEAIVVEHLGKRVRDADGWLTILDDLSFTIDERQTVAILGASGSGKSTLLGLLAGLDLPTEGSVTVFGESLFALDEDGRAAWRARNLGFVFQSFQLLPQMTALENVMLPLELAGERKPAERARRLLERVGLG